MQGHLVRSDLLKTISSQGCDFLAVKQLDKAVKQLIQILTDNLLSGESVEIRGFGSFRLRSQAARTIFNPLLNKKLAVPPKTKVVFKASKQLLDRLQSANKG